MAATWREETAFAKVVHHKVLRLSKHNAIHGSNAVRKIVCAFAILHHLSQVIVTVPNESEVCEHRARGFEYFWPKPLYPQTVSVDELPSVQFIARFSLSYVIVVRAASVCTTVMLPLASNV